MWVSNCRIRASLIEVFLRSLKDQRVSPQVSLDDFVIYTVLYNLTFRDRFSIINANFSDFQQKTNLFIDFNHETTKFQKS